MELDGKDIPDEAMTEIQQMIESNPNSISDEMLNQVVNDVSIPTNPVVTNPNENPANFDIKQKLTINKTEESADLYLTQEDFEGEYDYIPDVKSMSAGASMLMQRAREKAMEFVLNPNVSAMLQTASERLKIKELVVAILEDAGYKDAESLFEKSQPIQSGQPGQEGKPVKQISEQEQELLNQASHLLELVNSRGFQDYLKPFLITLSSEDIPTPRILRDMMR